MTCFFVQRDHRKRGISAQLIAAAAEAARRHGARLLAAYPVNPDSASYRYMGFVPALSRPASPRWRGRVGGGM